jgi:hypothetical protein
MKDMAAKGRWYSGVEGRRKIEKKRKSIEEEETKCQS